MAKKNFITEFKEFISRGNVVDMAVGVVVGTAFTAIVNSLVKDIIMPFVGWLIGGIDFGDFRIILSPAQGDTPETAILYGSFLNQVINFLIISFVVFCMIKLIGRLRRKKREEAPAAPPAPPEDVALLREIRDLLKAQVPAENGEGEA